MTTELLHAPSPESCASAIPVVLPVGPDHDPRPAVASSVRAASEDRPATRIVHVLVLNGTRPHRVDPEVLVKEVAECTDAFAVADIPEDIGYIRAVRAGLRIASDLGTRADLVGFLDADAMLHGTAHWARLEAALAEEASLDAISGMVVHEQCRMWETPSSRRFVDALAHGREAVSKPYIQGGAGGTLARRPAFEAAVGAALDLGTLIGPTLSASALAQGRVIRATSDLPCGHTARRTLEEWLTSVSVYERSWRRLRAVHGTGIERPWRDFLHDAEQRVRRDPGLARDLADCQALRRLVVERVEREEETSPRGTELSLTTSI
ncbi:hypothetical protein [Streptomyces chumphonensis]|uniref:hypothetical protein n=1 Tax=Streptomyces chumphonensis TaxID=1214925 RepID=UPI003D74741B